MPTHMRVWLAELEWTWRTLMAKNWLPADCRCPNDKVIRERAAGAEGHVDPGNMVYDTVVNVLRMWRAVDVNHYQNVVRVAAKEYGERGNMSSAGPVNLRGNIVESLLRWTQQMAGTPPHLQPWQTWSCQEHYLGWYKVSNSWPGGRSEGASGVDAPPSLRFRWRQQVLVMHSQQCTMTSTRNYGYGCVPCVVSGHLCVCLEQYFIMPVVRVVCRSTVSLPCSPGCFARHGVCGNMQACVCVGVRAGVHIDASLFLTLQYHIPLPRLSPPPLDPRPLVDGRSARTTTYIS